MPALVALAWTVLTAAPHHAPQRVDIGFDPRFELISVVFRVAEFAEYQACVVDEYAADVDRHFGSHREHRTVQLARSLRERLGYDAIASLAIRLKDARRFEPVRPLDDPALGLDRR